MKQEILWVSIRLSRKCTFRDVVNKASKLYNVSVELVESHQSNWLFFQTVTFMLCIEGETIETIEEFINNIK